MQKVRFWDPDHWRFRAEEARTVADQMIHEDARTIMRRIASPAALQTRSSWRKHPSQLIFSQAIEQESKLAGGW